MRLFVPADGRTGGRADKRTDGRTDGPVCPAPPGCGGPKPGEAAPPPASSHQQGALFPGAPPGAAARPPRRRPGVPYRKRKRPAPASGGRAVVGSPLLSLRVAARAMAATALPPLPPQFKSIQHHLRTAQELDKREPVVAYYCEWGGRGTAPPGPEPGPGPARPVASRPAAAPRDWGRHRPRPPVPAPGGACPSLCLPGLSGCAECPSDGRRSGGGGKPHLLGRSGLFTVFPACRFSCKPRPVFHVLYFCRVKTLCSRRAYASTLNTCLYACV